MKMAMKVASDALLDGLVFARDILWSGNNTAMLKLLAHRMQSRYGVDIWALRSPVEGDNATPSNAPTHIFERSENNVQSIVGRFL